MPLFHFSFFHNFFIFSLSSSLLPPRRSFLLVAPSSSSLLPPCSSFFLVQHCLNHLESIKGHFSSILTKALPTDQPTNGRTNQRTDKASYRDAKTHLKRRRRSLKDWLSEITTPSGLPRKRFIKEPYCETSWSANG